VKALTDITDVQSPLGTKTTSRQMLTGAKASAFAPVSCIRLILRVYKYHAPTALSEVSPWLMLDLLSLIRAHLLRAAPCFLKQGLIIDGCE
jgi:hypothetical protein